MPACQQDYPSRPYDTLQLLSTKVIATLSEILPLDPSAATRIQALLPALTNNSDTIAQQIKSDTAERQLTLDSPVSNYTADEVEKYFDNLDDEDTAIKKALNDCWREIKARMSPTDSGKEDPYMYDDYDVESNLLLSQYFHAGEVQITDLDTQSIRSFNTDPQYVTATVTLHPIPENSDEIENEGDTVTDAPNQQKELPYTFATAKAAIVSGLKAQRLQEARPVLEKALTQMKPSTQFWQGLSDDKIYNLLGETIALLEHCIALEPEENRNLFGIHRDYEALKALIQSQTQGENQNSLLSDLKKLPANIPGFNREKKVKILQQRASAFGSSAINLFSKLKPNHSATVTYDS